MTVLRLSRVLAIGALLATLALVVAATAAFADIPAGVDSYGGVAHAAGVHVVGGTSQLPNFSTGAIDNRYPLAAAGQDSSPSTHATGAVEDYGPLAGNIFSGDPPQPLCPDPPPAPGFPCTKIPFPPHAPPPDLYANAQYPGAPADSTYTSGQNANPPAATPDHAEAHAKELSADALATYSGDASSPFHNTTAESHTKVNADGSIEINTHSHVGSASFSNGVVKVSDVDVITYFKSVAGRAVVADTITVGSVTVTENGQEHPIALTDEGVTIPSQLIKPVPNVPTLPGQVVVPTGSALQTPVFHIFTVKPERQTEGGNGSMFATGLHIGMTTPEVNGIPSWYIEYILGEGQVVGSHTPSQPLSDFTSGSGSDFGLNDSSSSPAFQESFTGAAPSTIITKTKPGTATATRPGFLLSAAERIPLAYLFFLWEALVLGAAASWVWARRGRLKTA
ncbi:MAG: hypothetical protein QOE92_835 [Chloroflexota bacterium]|jgi:hypothetical protein|nr:hypothetical protein [Chloroflexota bacterium]